MDRRHRSFNLFLVALLVLLEVPDRSLVSGHGRLMDPPGRNSMWRVGFPNPVNYNDNELFCGGYAVQWDQNGGKCGICGDAYHLSRPRPHEAGGRFARGTIVRRYSPGQDIDVEIQLTANHLGRFEMYLCPNNNPQVEATQECFDRHPLYVSGTRDVNFEIPSDAQTKSIFRYRVRLPPYVTCTQCVIQWNYYTGNMWGTCANGTEGMGCGRPETFRNCADVSIVTSTGGTPPEFVPYDNPYLLYYKACRDGHCGSQKEQGYYGSQKAQGYYGSQKAHGYYGSQNTYGYYGSQKAQGYYDSDNGHGYYDSQNDNFPVVIRSQLCRPSRLYRLVPGMDDWCQSNCMRYPPFCPTGICECPETCEAIGEIAGKEGASVYCLDKCLVYPSNCPSHRCNCY